MMSELPEMRASDAERERVAEALREAVAEGRLDMEEFEERLDAAYKARTHAELEPLVRDLPVPGHTAVAGRTAPDPAVDPAVAERIGGSPTSSLAVAVFGGFSRKGRWTVPRRFTAFTLFGGGELDLREARFEQQEVVIRCFAVFGGVQITVDPDVDLRMNGVGIMGGFDHDSGADGEIPPGAPRVTVTGLALFGGVGVERKLRKDERRRLKAEWREERRERLAMEREERRERRIEEREERRDRRRKELG